MWSPTGSVKSEEVDDLKLFDALLLLTRAAVMTRRKQRWKSEVKRQLCHLNLIVIYEVFLYSVVLLFTSDTHLCSLIHFCICLVYK